MSYCILIVHMPLMCLEHSRNNASEKRQILTMGYSTLGFIVYLFVQRYFICWNCIYPPPHLTLTLILYWLWVPGGNELCGYSVHIPWVDAWIYAHYCFPLVKIFHCHLNVLFMYILSSSPHFLFTSTDSRIFGIWTLRDGIYVVRNPLLLMEF